MFEIGLGGWRRRFDDRDVFRLRVCIKGNLVAVVLLRVVMPFSLKVMIDTSHRAFRSHKLRHHVTCRSALKLFETDFAIHYYPTTQNTAQHAQKKADHIPSLPTKPIPGSPSQHIHDIRNDPGSSTRYVCGQSCMREKKSSIEFSRVVEVKVSRSE